LFLHKIRGIAVEKGGEDLKEGGREGGREGRKM